MAPPRSPPPAAAAKSCWPRSAVARRSTRPKASRWPRSTRSAAALVGLAGTVADLGVTASDFGQLAADALDDEVLVNAPRQPTAADIAAMLAGPEPACSPA